MLIPALIGGLLAVSSAPQKLHWTRFPVRVFVSASRTAPSMETEAVFAGLNEWQAASHGKVTYSIVTKSEDADITVQFEPVRFLSPATKTIGETRVNYCGTALQDASIRLAERSFVFEDLQEAAAHEFGHALGIQGHSDRPEDVMYPCEIIHGAGINSPLTEATHTVTQHDLDLLRGCYSGLF